MNLELIKQLPIGLQSDLVINRHDRELRDSGEFIALHSLKEPNFYFGNLLSIQDLNSRTVDQWQQTIKIPGASPLAKARLRSAKRGIC